MRGRQVAATTAGGGARSSRRCGLEARGEREEKGVAAPAHGRASALAMDLGMKTTGERLEILSSWLFVF
jgi:hypothetical protein